MLAILNIVLPVFALIFAGFAFRRLNILSATASVELNRFVVYLALPALMMDVMLNSSWSAIYHPGFLWTFELAVALIFAAVLIIRWLRARDLAGATLEATAASYANTGYIGLPLCALTFGANNLGPAMVAAILTVSANFAVSIVLLEFGLQNGKKSLASMGHVLRALLKNPLIVAPVAAGLVSAAGLALPQGILQSIKLLGNAASPCALVGIGLFLAQKQEPGNIAVSIELVAIKLIGQPLLAWWLAYHVFPMPPLWAKSAVLLSALPTGTGPYMLAELYRRGGGIASRTIFWSTFGSVLTLFFWLAIL